MADYEKVAGALASGADPDMLCMTCPWDRLCVNPPTMTADEVRSHIDAAEAKDRAQDPRRMPTGMLLTAITLSGRDQMGQLCPVFTLRLRSPQGRALSDSMRTLMQGGGDRG